MFKSHMLKKPKGSMKLWVSLVLACIMFSMTILPAQAASPQKTVNASAQLAYNLKGLKHNVVVQKAYIADKYLYVTQRSQGTCYLSRLLIDGTDANYVDEMTVTNTGHCQTLDMYTYNGENYFYFSSKQMPPRLITGHCKSQDLSMPQEPRWIIRICAGLLT